MKWSWRTTSWDSMLTVGKRRELPSQTACPRWPMLGKWWAHVAQQGPSRSPRGLAHHLPIVGICWASQVGAKLGWPSIWTQWAGPNGAQLGWSSICPQWANGGHAEPGPSWAGQAYDHNGRMMGTPNLGPAGLANHLPIVGICDKTTKKVTLGRKIRNYVFGIYGKKKARRIQCCNRFSEIQTLTEVIAYWKMRFHILLYCMTSYKRHIFRISKMRPKVTFLVILSHITRHIYSYYFAILRKIQIIDHYYVILAAILYPRWLTYIPMPLKGAFLESATSITKE